MKANELRIGNLFIEENSNTIIEVIGLEKNRVIFSGMFLEPWNAMHIPITQEWLLKFRFKQKGSFYRIKDSRFVEVIIHDEGIDVCNHSVYLPHIKSVHQLQNLYFSLTGEELEIKTQKK